MILDTEKRLCNGTPIDELSTEQARSLLEQIKPIALICKERILEANQQQLVRQGFRPLGSYFQRGGL